jgi:threonine/homoserine/homoserine lactone efflux protein
MAQALPGISGALMSDLLLIAAVAAGLGSLLVASSWTFEVLKWVGVVYLGWLGLRLLRDPGSPVSQQTSGKCASTSQRFRQSLLVAITNPKGYLFFSALLPAFIDPARSLWPQYLGATVLFTSLDAIAMLAYAALGWAGSRWTGPQALRRLNRLSGGALLLLAASLGWAQRPGPAVSP